jgi:hypothetical protein
MSEPKTGEPNPLNSIVSSGLKATTAGSLISASLKLQDDSDWPGTETRSRLGSGDELRIRQRDSEVYADILAAGKVVDREPTGTFTLADGKTMEFDKGRLVGGTSLNPEAWLMFALLTDWPQQEEFG